MSKKQIINLGVHPFADTFISKKQLGNPEPIYPLVCYQDKEKFPKGPWGTVGDYVCYGKHSGQKIQYKGLKFILLYDDQVIMKVENPKTLDPTFNLSKH